MRLIFGFVLGVRHVPALRIRNIRLGNSYVNLGAEITPSGKVSPGDVSP